MSGERLSRRLSYVLRHAPESVGLTLDAGGWVGVDELLMALAAHGATVSREELDQVVAASDKQRFAFDATGARIRASQGHSVPVALGYDAQSPPAILFHGTSVSAVPQIFEQGLRPGRRHAVHLSDNETTARAVGRRHGSAVVLRVDTAAMARAGAEFTRSANGVWLVAEVPPQFLTVL